MKTLIVYFSKFGNTRRVAQVVAESLKPVGETRVVSIDKLAASDFEGVDLRRRGQPHACLHRAAGGPSRPCRTACRDSGRQIRGRVRHDGSALAAPAMRASPKILRQLRTLGGKPIAPPQTFFVRTSGTQQPGETNLLLEGQLDRAQEWAGHLLVGRAWAPKRD